MVFDYKKEYKNLYIAKNVPEIIEIPKITYLAVRGNGDPNIEDGEYKKAIELLYTVMYTIKMSKKTDKRITNYFDFVVPPLEGFWWQDGIKGVDYSHKEKFSWISLIRLPEFVQEEDIKWAISEASKKKKLDYSKIEILHYKEGLSVQCMHIGPYNNEVETVEKMDKYIEEKGYRLDINDYRYHHEIYLSDVRKVASDKLKTVIRHPIKKYKINIKEKC
jgi:hypothetical protein